MKTTSAFFTAALLFAGAAVAQSASTVTVTDLAGRTVTVPRDPQRVVYGESRYIFATAILDREDPFKRIIGWNDDLQKYVPDTYEVYRKKFPHIDKVPVLGSAQKDLSAEKIISSKADLVIFSTSMKQVTEEAGLPATLDKAGIPYIYVDFREHPIRNAPRSIELLGKVFGTEARAREFNQFYNHQVNVVLNRVRNIKPEHRPVVFFENAAGYSEECCRSAGKFNWGEMVTMAGGKHWGSQQRGLANLGGMVTAETLIALNPPIILMSGADWGPTTKAVPLGYGATQQKVDQNIQVLSQRTGFPNLNAVKNKRYHAIFHQFYNSPYNIFAVQQMGKWIHPEAFKDVNPDANFKEMHRRFLPVEFQGVFWNTLK